MNVSVQQLASLQAHTERIRNVCILAHVDHGKTTMSDHLIGSNGLIHPKLVGELRFLDSRDDEQARGITMKSSSISLLYVPDAAYLPEGPQSCTQEDRLRKGYLVNLIDSPGHVDFCSEVSTAVRLSDGAIVVVDAVEGVCIQTHAVLRQAWQEKVRLCLVINKMDRMIQELHLTPAEAYQRLRSIVTHVNMIISSFQSEEFISEADAVLAHEAALASGAGLLSGQAGMRDLDEDEEPYFEPEKGNVAFASAMDGWGFRISHFAKLYAAKLGANAGALTQALWGDFAFNAKTKRIIKIKPEQQHKLTPLFVQLALDPVWKAYEACSPGADTAAQLGKIVKALQLTQVSDKALVHPDPKLAVRAVMRSWLPLAEAVLSMVVATLPNPAAAAPERLDHLLPLQPAELRAAHADAQTVQASAAVLVQDLERIRSGMLACTSTSNAPCVCFISKMVAVPASAVPRQAGAAPLAATQGNVFVAFGRVFSGLLRDGDTVHVLSAAYHPSRPHEHCQEVKINGLFLMMGRALEIVSEVPAGCVLAVGGLETAILKSATLSTSLACPPLAPMVFQASPIVRVALEPVRPEEMTQLEEGLRLLNRADPFVEVALQDSGEHVLGAAGEVHLEMCIKDLQERFAKIELHVSEPLVAFRESVFLGSEAPDLALKPPKVIEATTANGRCTIRVQAHPIPASIASLLDDNGLLIRAALTEQRQKQQEAESKTAAANDPGQQLKEDAALAEHENTHQADLAELSEVAGRARGQALSTLQQLQARLQSCLKDAPSDTQALLPQAWLLGPKSTGPNLLLSGQASRLWESGGDTVHYLGGRRTAEAEHDATSLTVQAAEVRSELALGSAAAAELLGLDEQRASVSTADGTASPALQGKAAALEHSIEAGIVAGFQLATAAGPLCDEPMWGVAFEVSACLHAKEAEVVADTYGPLSGQVTSIARQAFRRAVMEAGPCLVEAMSLCEVSAGSEALAGLFAVLRQRRARVVSDEMREGSDLFSVLAHLPVQASFGFVDDMRRRSSGAASASLMLSHWERLQVDPFFVPTTEEEREEFGEEGQGMIGRNLARVLIDQVRQRKGLPVDRKVVESATKQRTRARKV